MTQPYAGVDSPDVTCEQFFNAGGYMWSPTSKGHKVGPAIQKSGGLYITTRRKLEFPQATNPPKQQLYWDNPTEVGRLRRLERLALNNNSISGQIPSNISGCSNLLNISLHYNQLFTGSIPVTISNATNLNRVIFAFNKLTGNVPSLEMLHRLDVFSIFGNLLGNGGGNDLSFLCSLTNASNLRRVTIAFNNLGGDLPDCISNFSTALSLLDLQANKMSGSIPPGLGNLINLEILTASNNKLSGILHDHGALLVAIKVINLSHHRTSKSFLAECEALRNIRHRNLVKVLTVCSSVDYQNCDFKAVVYEFMVNGNLDEWLHQLQEQMRLSEQRNLSLLQMMNIAIDVANALEYLHHDCETPIVHCDLKPSNVLLDDEMTARVGDFGLARFLLKHPRFSTNQSSSIGVRNNGLCCSRRRFGNRDRSRTQSESKKKSQNRRMLEFDNGNWSGLFCGNSK
ncbi:hypothetical protein CJ030_MR5G018796 [Morella rubra]|uniref:Protein kinase domain-containing protein n=1 Tax=Morella rubra TaxID=262757 RepID=A0A6A1VPM9_9ROSI|nr:hypothetical protein CJ030_MR5G018796 [Morella rubra]